MARYYLLIKCTVNDVEGCTFNDLRFAHTLGTRHNIRFDQSSSIDKSQAKHLPVYELLSFGIEQLATR